MLERITVNPDICNGRPVIRNTRIAVQSVLEFMASGDLPDQILEEFPMLQAEDVQACLEYASRLMGNSYSIEALA